MPTPIWSNVAVDVQTALSAAKAVNGITKANPAVATAPAHGYANGDLVLLLCTGMAQLKACVVRVAAKTDDTFQLEGIDSTLFGTFTSGTAQKITFGASASTFQDVNATGGEAAGVDMSTIHTDDTIEVPGRRSALKYAMGSLWDPADPALLELKRADEAKAIRAIRIGFAGGAFACFVAYPSCPIIPAGSQGQAVTTPVGLSLAGRVTAYAS